MPAAFSSFKNPTKASSLASHSETRAESVIFSLVIGWSGSFSQIQPFSPPHETCLLVLGHNVVRNDFDCSRFLADDVIAISLKCLFKCSDPLRAIQSLGVAKVYRVATGLSRN